MTTYKSSIPGSKLGSNLFLYNCQIAFCFKLILFIYFTSSCDELYIFHLCIHYSLSSLLFPCQLLTFANSLYQVQYQQNVGSDLDADHLTL